MLKNFLHELVFALSDAWKELIDLPLPANIGLPAREKVSPLLAGAFPLLGWLLGSVPFLAGALAGWLFNRYAGVLIFTFAAWAVLYFKDSGRSSSALCRIVMQRTGGRADTPVLSFVVEALRFAALTVIALQGGMALFPLLLAGAFGIQADLATDRFNPEPLLPVEGRLMMRRVMISALILALFFNRLAALVLALLFFIILHTAADKLKQEKFTPEAVTAAGYFTEWLLLGAAVLTA